MLLRAAMVAGVFCLPFLSGCAGTECPETNMNAPPPPRFDNFQRLGEEVAWFYADIQDTIFGLDYDCHIERTYGEGPYE